jgi:hypothetical protein
MGRAGGLMQCEAFGQRQAGEKWIARFHAERVLGLSATGLWEKPLESPYRNETSPIRRNKCAL